MEANYFTILWWFLPYIDMNQPRVYMPPPHPLPPTPTVLRPLPSPSPSHPSGLSQCIGFECPVSCIKLGLVIYFTYGNIHVSMPFSQIIPPSPPTEKEDISFKTLLDGYVHLSNSTWLKWHLSTQFLFQNPQMRVAIIVGPLEADLFLQSEGVTI